MRLVNLWCKKLSTKEGGSRRRGKKEGERIGREIMEERERKGDVREEKKGGKISPQ